MVTSGVEVVTSGVEVVGALVGRSTGMLPQQQHCKCNTSITYSHYKYHTRHMLADTTNKRVVVPSRLRIMSPMSRTMVSMSATQSRASFDSAGHGSESKSSLPLRMDWKICCSVSPQKGGTPG